VEGRAAGYGPLKTLYNHVVRWTRLGVFERILAGLADKSGASERLMIDAIHLKADRAAASLAKWRCFPAASAGPEVG
jgi:putative transposase